MFSKVSRPLKPEMEELLRRETRERQKVAWESGYKAETAGSSWGSWCESQSVHSVNSVVS